MKRLLSILFLLSVSGFSQAFDLTLTKSSIYVWHSDSLDEDSNGIGVNGYVTGFRRSHYFFAWEACMNPTYTNEYYDLAHSGQTMDFRITNDVPLGTPGVVGYRTNQMPVYLFSTSTDNGLLTSNNMYIAQSNMCQLMTNMSAGAYPLVAQTGILSSNHPVFVIVGNPPEVVADGGDSRATLSMRGRNAACTNAGINFAAGYVDLFNPLYTGWTSDAVATGGKTLGSLPGGHIAAAGSLNMTMEIEKQLHPSDTNISLCIVDWNSSTPVLTNHCTAVSISKSGTTLSWTYFTTRMPGGWDVSTTDPTNQATPRAWQVIPAQADYFKFTIGVSNLPAGNYQVQIDGVTVATLPSSALTTGLGWNMLTNTVGPIWNQRLEVLRRIRVAQNVDTNDLHELGNDQGLGKYGSTAFSFWVGGAKGDTLIADLDTVVTGLKTNWTAINQAAQQTNHTFVITPAATTPDLNATTMSAGTAHWGQ